MTVDSKDNAYAAALGWATEFIGKLKAKGALGSTVPEAAYGLAAQAYDRIRGELEKTNPGLASVAIGDKSSIGLGLVRDVGIGVLAESKPEMDNFLRGFSAALIERGTKLPQPLAEFAAASLREPKTPQRRGPKALGWRDLMIGNAVQHVHKNWGFLVTRRRDGKKRVHCAVSIVREALAANKVGLSEDGIIKAYDKTRRLMKTYYKPIMSEKLVTEIRNNLPTKESDGPDAASKFVDLTAPEVVKYMSHVLNNPADHRDLIEEFAERMERRRPGYFQLADRTDRRK